MNIRPTNSEDLPTLLAIYQRAREFMARSGNPTQWKSNRPAPAKVEEDISLGRSFVLEDGGTIQAVFALIEGADPTYSYIEGPGWPDEAPYATLHRIASEGTLPGAGKACFQWCVEYCRNKKLAMRVDTHRDNAPMQGLLNKFGFTYCGIIYVDDGTPRLAYHRNFSPDTEV